jgi:hypothetical protein
MSAQRQQARCYPGPSVQPSQQRLLGVADHRPARQVIMEAAGERHSPEPVRPLTGVTDLTPQADAEA